MNWAKFYGPVVASAAAVAALGAVHGGLTDRWGPSEPLTRSVSALDRVPVKFGDWEGEDMPYPADQVKRAGVQGSVFRRYKNTHTGEAVSVLLVCGRGGPISVHTPDVCYAGSGYRAVTDEAVRTFSAGEGDQSFRVARFAMPGGTNQSQSEVCWAWSADGRRWQGPEAGQARVAFGRSPAVFKLYVVRDFLPGSRAESADPCGDFLRRALPDLAALSPEG